MALERPAGSPPCTPFMPVFVRSVRLRTTAACWTWRGLVLALLRLAAAQRSGPARPCRTGAPCARSCRATGAPRRRASRTSCPAGGCTKRNVQPACRDDMSAVPSATQSVTPLPATVSHSCFARAPPLRGVAGEDALARAVARHAGADAERVRRLRRVADVHGGPEGTRSLPGVRALRLRARGGGEEVTGSLAGVGLECRLLGHDDARWKLGRGVRAGRQIQGSSRRRRDKGCGACDQNRGGG